MNLPLPHAERNESGAKDPATFIPNSNGFRVGRALQLVGAGLLLLSVGMLVAWAVRLFGGSSTSRDSATIGVVTFGVWALIGALFLAVGTFIRRPKKES
jgi:hypothetical protein